MNLHDMNNDLKDVTSTNVGCERLGDVEKERDAAVFVVGKGEKTAKVSTANDGKWKKLTRRWC